MVCGEICVVSAVHVTKNRCRSPLRVGSTCNVGEKLATYAHVADMSATYLAKLKKAGMFSTDSNFCFSTWV